MYIETIVKITPAATELGLQTVEQTLEFQRMLEEAAKKGFAAFLAVQKAYVEDMARSYQWSCEEEEILRATYSYDPSEDDGEYAMSYVDADFLKSMEGLPPEARELVEKKCLDGYFN